ncbi:MAG: energy-coupling factor transporter ATPase [Christensenellales bacterium]
MHGIDLDIEEGSFVAVLGHNGSGKSTLAKLLNMILLPDSGRIVIDGRWITPDMDDDEVAAVRRDIGMVFQNPDNQIVATVVEEDVAFGPENLGVPPEQIRARVDAALEAVGMTEFARHSPHQLSGGQKQRVAIAGVIAMEPRCIIFDESTAMLDPQGRAEVMRTIGRLNREKGITVLHITHNMNEAIEADRVIVINDGRICLDDKPRRVFSHLSQLGEMGLDVPQVTELVAALSESGFRAQDGSLLPQDIIGEEEGAELIAAALGFGGAE